MKNHYLLFILFAFLLQNNQASATKTTVNTLVSLTTTFTAARPGDTIVIANGSYNWGKISLNNTFGTATSAWIVVMAQTRSNVVFTDSTFLMFSGYRILIDGFKFANGNSRTNAVVAFRTTTSILAYYSRVSNITFDNYNSIDSVENEWVGMFGTNNRLDHCTFINKSNARSTVVVWYSTAIFPARSISTYHRIDSNYFKGRSYMGGNGGETIRLGVGNNSRTFGYNTVEYNLFEGLTQVELEIVSNKSYYNTYRYNTFKNCNGGLTLRMGKYCSVYGNFFINDDPTKTGSYGIRIIDKGHKVYNNYCEGLLGATGSLTSIRCPIVTYNGTYPSSDSLNPLVLDGAYLPADSALIANNTIVNCPGGMGIKLGNYDGGMALNQALGATIANNIIKLSSGQAVYIDPTNTSLTYFAEGNMYSATSGLGIANTAGFANTALTFGTRVNGILTPPTVVQDAALNSTSYNAIIGNLDAQGQTRSAIFDLGCDEINGSGMVSNFPLDSNAVGAGKPIIVLRSQTISFSAIPTKAANAADFNPGATASSGLAVVYTSSNTAVATIVNNNIRIIGYGTSTITATQSGNSIYLAATSVSQTLNVTSVSQTISFSTIPVKAANDVDFNPGATASSGLAVIYTSSNSAVATIVNNNIHIVGYGTALITASQSGNQVFSPAIAVTQTLTVTGLSQTISFAAIPSKVVNATPDFNPGATATSGLTVSYTSSNTAVATIVNNNIRIVGYGTSTITATQIGNNVYFAAPAVSQTLTVTGLSQNISFAALPAKIFGDADFAPGATTTSGLAISYTSSNLAVATIVNNNIKIVGAGTAVITASQSGNSTYFPATSVNQILTVTKTYTYAPTSTTVSSGSINSGAFGNLATNNSSYFVVRSTTSGTRRVDWYGAVTITQAPSTVTKLIINYDGKNSASKTQILYLYNWVTAAWVQIDSRTVSTTDVTITHTPSAFVNYISSTGQIRLRVFSSGGTSNYTCSGDWIQFQVQSTSAAKGGVEVANYQYASATLKLFPNPSIQYANLHYFLSEDSKVSISIIDINGKQIKSVLNSEFQSSGNVMMQIDHNGLPKGIYFIKVIINNKISNIKMLIN
jgi:hypothetical protein